MFTYRRGFLQKLETQVRFMIKLWEKKKIFRWWDNKLKHWPFYCEVGKRITCFARNAETFETYVCKPWPGWMFMGQIQLWGAQHHHAVTLPAGHYVWSDQLCFQIESLPASSMCARVNFAISPRVVTITLQIGCWVMPLPSIPASTPCPQTGRTVFAV